MERLFIRLIETADRAFITEWALYQDDRKIVSSSTSCPLSELKNALPATDKPTREIVLLIPSEHVLHTQADVPLKQAKHASRIIPYLIEEQLADPVQDYHIAFNAKHGYGQPIEVLAVNKYLFSQWLSTLEAQGLVPDEVFSELQLLPTVEDKIIVLTDEQKRWVRAGKHAALCTEPEISASVLHHIQRQFDMDDALIEDVDTSSETVLEYLISQYLSSGNSSPMNILQGSFSRQSTMGGTLFKQLALIAAIWFLGILTINFFQLGYYYYESSYYREQTLTLYKQLFPTDNKIIDPRQQMETHISSGTSTAGFLGIMNKVSSSIGSAANLAASAKGMAYDSDTKLLSLTLQSSNMQSVNQLAMQLQNSGVNAKVQPLNNAENTIVLEISEDAP